MLTSLDVCYCCCFAVLVLAALKGEFLLPDLEDAIWQFEVELAEFGPNLKEVGCCTLAGPVAGAVL